MFVFTDLYRKLVVEQDSRYACIVSLNEEQSQSLSTLYSLPPGAMWINLSMNSCFERLLVCCRTCRGIYIATHRNANRRLNSLFHNILTV